MRRRHRRSRPLICRRHSHDIFRATSASCSCRTREIYLPSSGGARPIQGDLWPPGASFLNAPRPPDRDQQASGLARHEWQRRQAQVHSFAFGESIREQGYWGQKGRQGNSSMTVHCSSDDYISTQPSGANNTAPALAATVPQEQCLPFRRTATTSGARQRDPVCPRWWLGKRLRATTQFGHFRIA